MPIKAPSFFVCKDKSLNIITTVFSEKKTYAKPAAIFLGMKHLEIKKTIPGDGFVNAMLN